MTILRGVGISPGKIQGLAFVHDQSRNISADAKGMILVVDIPELVLVLQGIKFGIIGIISEHGTRTSHGCVIAKSADIPCISSVSNLARYISFGQEIILDGDTGIVEILDESNKAIYGI